MGVIRVAWRRGWMMATSTWVAVAWIAISKSSAGTHDVFLLCGHGGWCLRSFRSKAAALPLFRHVRDALRFDTSGRAAYDVAAAAVAEFDRAEAPSP